MRAIALVLLGCVLIACSVVVGSGSIEQTDDTAPEIEVVIGQKKGGE